MILESIHKKLLLVGKMSHFSLLHEIINTKNRLYICINYEIIFGWIINFIDWIYVQLHAYFPNVFDQTQYLLRRYSYK